MCRLLFVKSIDRLDSNWHLSRFAQMCRDSVEYQGHGWGCAWLEQQGWQVYRNLSPIWEDNLEQFGPTTCLLAHARSAFRNEGIAIENNMPFHAVERVFIFNGELHGVRIKEAGRIGAEKIFNFLRRFERASPVETLTRNIPIIQRRTKYVRAMNLILADLDRAALATSFNENHAYFTMHRARTKQETVICSEPYPGVLEWQPISNHTIEAI